MTIAEAREKCKSAIAAVPRDVLVVGVVLAASILSFGLGYLAGMDAGKGSRVSIESFPLPPPGEERRQEALPRADATTGKFVASKNGTKYYLPECAGAKRISESNKVWFASVAQAVAAGYAPAANCSGI